MIESVRGGTEPPIYLGFQSIENANVFCPVEEWAIR